MPGNFRCKSLKTKKSGTHKVTHFFRVSGRNSVVTNPESQVTSHSFLIDTPAIRNASKRLKTKRGGSSNRHGSDPRSAIVLIAEALLLERLAALIWPLRSRHSHGSNTTR